MRNDSPKIGDEQMIGKSKCRWFACVVCGKERWVRLEKGVPRSKTCRQHDTPETKERKRQRLLGRICSQETRDKISKAGIGHRPYCRPTGWYHTDEAKQKMRGIQVTEATREKLRQANLGRKVSAETREKLSLSHLGKHFIYSPEAREGLVQRNKQPITEETREKLRQSRLGQRPSEKTLKALRESSLARWQNSEYREKTLAAFHSPESRKKAAATMIGHPVPLETRDRIRDTLTGHDVSGTTRKKIGGIHKSLWANPEYKANLIRLQRAGMLVKPNKPEKSLLSVLNELLPGEWRFVGDGSFVIAGKNPDFVNINGKKQIIELFGDYWHKGEDPDERITLFREFGYETLVVWERELKNQVELVARIKEFVG